MDTIRLEKMYVPTMGSPGPLVVMTSTPGRRQLTALQTVTRPGGHVAQRVFKTAMECKKAALQVTSAVVIKLASIGKSIIKYVKKDFLKKEGVPLKGLVIYKGGYKSKGRIVKSGTRNITY